MAGESLTALTLGAIAALAATLTFGAHQRQASLELTHTRIGVRIPAGRLFQSSDACIACHNSMRTPQGEDVSFGAAWRGSMMANSARDPYWQASVRRETIEHASHAAEIQDECAACHMPMARYEAKARGEKGEVFAHLPIGDADSDESLLAADGVSCTMCHQLSAEGLGGTETFGGQFRVDDRTKYGKRRVYGPYDIDSGRVRVMHSSSEFIPTRGDHIRKSELCASCHTLFTKALDETGKVVGSLPEQVPYLEWQGSAFAATNSCQSCHMPAVTLETPISGVLGQPREKMSRHDFRGGNFFMQDMLGRYRDELGVVATRADMTIARTRTLDHLAASTGSLTLSDVRVANGRLQMDVRVENLTGHKFPTAYPSRRAWLHVVARDARGAVVFESGAVEASGAIVGNDNDRDATKYEPHYRVISSADEVQVYESIMADSRDRVTTSLLAAAQYLKDNRLLPRGFQRTVVPAPTATIGVSDDNDFASGVDVVRYDVDVSRANGAVRVEVELLFQPIGYRWAKNLGTGTAEAAKFQAMYDGLSTRSSAVIAKVGAVAR